MPGEVGVAGLPYVRYSSGISKGGEQMRNDFEWGFLEARGDNDWT